VDLCDTTDHEQIEAAVAAGCRVVIRYSVGIEDADDLMADLGRALESA